MAGKKITQLSSSLSPSLTGFTAVADGGVTYKSSLQTLRNVLVDSGSHVFTGDQVIKGNLTVSGSLTAEEYILSSSITNIVLETISGSSHFGNDLNDVHNFTGSVNITGSLTVDHLGTIDQLVVGTPPFDELGAEALHVGTMDDINIAHFEGNNNIYAQINVRNRDSGSLSSSDIVATADNGNEFIHYVDLGINSSTYNGGFVGLADDSYLLNVGKDMYVGTVGGANFPAKLKLFAENSWENPQITISGSNLVSFNTGSVSEGFEFEFSGSAKFDHNVEIVSGTTTTKEVMVGFGEFHTSSLDREALHVGTEGSINVAHFEGNNEVFTQINLVNTNSGSSASGDIVVTADNGNDNVHFVDLGINSSTYNAGFVGRENDSYLINAGKDLYVGTIGGVNHPDTKLHLFAQNNWENSPVIISGSNQISFNTGSVTTGFMYEFSGSAKFDNDINVDGYVIGDGSQLTNLPTIDTGSFAITGSNVFSGSQTISGSLSIEDGHMLNINGIEIHASSSMLFINGDIVPELHNTQSLGTSDVRWKDVWVGPGTIFIADAVNMDHDIALEAIDNNLVVSGSAGLVVGEFTLQDNTIKITDPSRDIEIGIPSATGNVIFNRSVVMKDPSGSVTFQTFRDGRTKHFVPNITAGTSAVSIIGSEDGVEQMPVRPGNLLHLTGNPDRQARLTISSYGSGSAANPVITGRNARGTASTPSNVQNGDTLMSIQGVSWVDSGYAAQTQARMNFVATENYTTSSQGSKIEFITTEQGTSNPSVSLTLDSNGLDLPTGNDYKVNGVSYTSSLVTTSSFNNFKLTIEGVTGSYATTGSNTFVDTQIISGSVYITGDVLVAGNSVIQNISSSILDIGTNLITVNTATPAVRYGGLAVIDSGSLSTSASLLYDSTAERWVMEHKGGTTSSVLIMGPHSYNDLGNEVGITTNRIPKGIGTEHIGDSQISDNGTDVTIPNNLVITGSLKVGGSEVVKSNQTSSMNVLTSSYSFNSTSSSFAQSSVSSSYSFNSTSSSFAQNAVSSSYSVTSSFSLNSGLLNGKSSSEFATTGSNIFLGTETITGSLKVSGSVELISPIKLNSIIPVIDGALSSSYIFSSGSTNDIFLTRNSNGLNNTTRLRWIEGNLYSGLLYGGLITSQSSTVYQIGSGSGVIVNLNATTSSSPYPVVTEVSWSNLSSSIAPLSASFDQSFVGVQLNGTIVAQGTPFIDGQIDTLIPIGVVTHLNRSTITNVKTSPVLSYGYKQRNSVFTRAFGPLKLSGLSLLPSGSSTGSLVVTSGTAFADGANYVNDPNNSSFVSDTGTTTSKIFRYYQSGSAWVYDTNGGSGYETIDPTKYSNNGVLTAVPDKKWTIQRAYWFTNSTAKAIVMYYGNTFYNTETEANTNINNESFNESPNTAASAVYLGSVVLRNNGKFTDDKSYGIIPGGLFRNIGGVGGGGTTQIVSLNGLSDVVITGSLNGQPLVYNSSSLMWENSSTLTASLFGNATTSTTSSFSLNSGLLNGKTSSEFAITGSNTFVGDQTINGTLNVQQTSEVVNSITGATGTVSHDFTTGAIFYHSSIASNFTLNLANVPTTNNRGIGLTIVLSQGATPFIPNAFQVNGVPQTIKWVNNVTPTGNANKIDIAGFNLLRVGSAWTVLGQLSTFG